MTSPSLSCLLTLQVYSDPRQFWATVEPGQWYHRSTSYWDGQVDVLNGHQGLTADQHHINLCCCVRSPALALDLIVLDARLGRTPPLRTCGVLVLSVSIFISICACGGLTMCMGDEGGSWPHIHHTRTTHTCTMPPATFAPFCRKLHTTE